MSFTKNFLLVAGLLVSTAAFSASPAPGDFQAAKAAHIANIQARLQSVQKQLSCVEAAQDVAAIKVCHDAAKEERQALVEKMKLQRAERKAQRQAKHQAPAAPAAK